MAYKILSLDGGGVYGVLLPVIIKKMLEKRPDFLDKIDMVAGTSIGSFVGIGLINNIPPDTIIKLFQSFAKEVFKKPDLNRKIGGNIGLCAWYDNKSLRKILVDLFGQTKLKDLNKTVLVPAFKLHNDKGPNPNWKAKIFHNQKGARCDGEQLAVDVIMASTAVPVVLPTSQGYIDGAFVSNNPALLAITQTQDKRYEGNPVPLNEVKVFSIGKDSGCSFIEGNSLDWGYLKWISPLIDICLSKDAVTVNFQCEKFLGNNYFRQDVFIGKEHNFSIDDATAVDKIIELTNKISVDKAIKWLDKNWN